MMNKKKTFFTGDLFVLFNVVIISFPGWRFLLFIKSANHCDNLW